MKNMHLFTSRAHLHCLRSILSWLAMLLLGALIGATPALADPPGRIGRVAWVSGTAHLQNGSTGDSFRVPLNQPLTSGDILTTEAGSRVEIQIGSKTVRIDANSVLEFDRIDDEQVRLYLTDGRAIVKLATPEAMRDFEMATRIGRFNARDTGIYRFDTDANGSSATAYYGGLHFAGPDSTLDVRAGESTQFWNDGQTRYRLSSVINDEFTQWSAARDQRPRATAYSRYVSPEMTGAEDLDAYGNWSETPEYGAIWYPRAVAADWAPYRTGHWVWVAPWGWSWVDSEPWGFAPFHYGRWVRHRGAWGWVPGTRIARPVYAPAMVAWIGAPGGSVSVSIGAVPTVGWFPLAPREIYVPVYRSSATYIRNVNITHVTRITNVTNIINSPQTVVQRAHYAHRNLPQAVTVVPAAVMTHRRPVGPAMLPPGDRWVLRGQALQAAAPVAAPRPAARAPNERPERPGESFGRHRDERRDTRIAPPVTPADRVTNSPTPAPQAPRLDAQRNEQPGRDGARPQFRPDPSAPRPADAVRATPPRRDLAVPPSAPQTPSAPQVPAAPAPTRALAPQVPSVTPPSPVPPPPMQAVAPPPAILAPRAPIIAPPQHNSPPRHDAVQPAPQPRPERIEPRAPERSSQRDPGVAQAIERIRPAPAARPEQPAQTARESRAEPLRERARPPEVRPQAHSQARPAEPSHPAPTANDDKPRRHGSGPEKP